ncbi:hypothetical protein E4U17_001900 [Claviceps sp. LM77 group G4]|nr:hypothetical protein E4U17_001900 [Claviceps sp. LM77 group G4]
MSSNNMASLAIDPDVEDERFAREVEQVKTWWSDSRWRFTKRPFTAEQIVSKRGHLQIEYASNVQAKKLWGILEERFKSKDASYTYGCLEPTMLTQMAKYLDTVYVSGWQSSSTASSSDEPGPDLADYPYTTVPNKVGHLFMAQLFHDRKQRQERISTPRDQRAAIANVDYLRPIIADADTGHGGLTAVMKLTKLFIEKGAAGIHIEEIRRRTREEVTRFASGAEDGTENLDLKALAASLKDSNSLVTYLPGDIIEVYSGEQKGVVGKATNVQGEIVTMSVTEGDLRGQIIEVPIKGLRKCFKVGDHVKVIGGSKFRDEVGTVVKISEDRVTLLTDQTNTEVTVFSKDLREASDIGGQGSLGQFSLHDLVQLDLTTVGCIVKIDRESLVVLDQYGDTRQAMPSQISNKLPQRKQAVAADRDGSEIRLDDVVKEYTGQHRQGKIIHIHRSYVFLHTNDSNENAGVFVTKASMVNTVAAKGGRVNTATSGPDLSSMNPALKTMKNSGETRPSQPIKMFGRDRAINQTAIVKRGPYKGLLGIVKDTTDTHARVELHTKGKTITVPRESLSFKDKTTGATIDINGRGRGAPEGAGRGGGDRLPAWHGSSRTPMSAGNFDRIPAWGSRTPAQAGGRTPAWKAQDYSGSRTPAWADGSRTVNPYDGSRTAYGSGSRTPAWQSGARTPAVGDAFGPGSRTPAYTSTGGSDSWTSGSKTPAWGASAPTPGAGVNEPWGYTPGVSVATYDAPTPGAAISAPTPGALNAPTPGPYSAPTPATNAPTPGAGWQGGWGADPAPASGAAALTPGAGGYYGAPTPAAYGGIPETPAASGPQYTENL